MSGPPDLGPSSDRNGQLIASSLTLLILGAIGIGLVWAGWSMMDFKEVGIPLGVVVGALANSLTAPSGIANVLRAANPAPP